MSSFLLKERCTGTVSRIFSYPRETVLFYRASGGNIHADRYRCSGACARRSLDWTDFDLALGFTTLRCQHSGVSAGSKSTPRRSEGRAQSFFPSRGSSVFTGLAEDQ